MTLLKPERTFQDVSRAVERVRPPPKYDTYWSGTYLLLVGAAYSIGCADKIANSIGRRTEADRWPALKAALLDGKPLQIERYWGETHFLTNAIFRIAHSVDRLGKPSSESRAKHEHRTGYLA